MHETQIPETQIQNQLKQEIKIEIKGELRRYPVVYLHHDRPIYGFTQPVLLRFGHVWWVGFLPPRLTTSIYPGKEDTAEFAIHELKQPFYVIPIERELSSNTGRHKVLYYLESPLNLYPRSNFNPVALYTIDEIHRFPRGARPDPDYLEKLKDRGMYYIAWTVSEGVDILWILRYVSYNFGIDVRIEGIESMEQLIESMETLQGNLRYMKVNTIITNKLYYRRFRIYGHMIESEDPMGFVNILPVSIKLITDYERTVGILAFLEVGKDSRAIIRHERHGDVYLEPGYYILWHRKPTSQRED